MSKPDNNANCLNCYNKKTCGIAYYKRHDENGKPEVDCYGYCKETTEEDIENSTWSNTKY